MSVHFSACAASVSVISVQTEGATGPNVAVAVPAQIGEASHASYVKVPNIRNVNEI